MTAKNNSKKQPVKLADLLVKSTKGMDNRQLARFRQELVKTVPAAIQQAAQAALQPDEQDTAVNGNK